MAEAQRQRGGLVIADGDWNGYASAGQLTHPALEELPAHLRPARMRPGADGGLEPDYELAAGRRTPPELTSTGVTGGARVDRIYLTGSLVPALERYEQAATGGSDHQALVLTLSTDAAAGITPGRRCPRAGPACLENRPEDDR